MTKHGHTLLLTTDQLYHHCDPKQFDFTSTEQLLALECMLGQDRAAEAVKFGIGIQRNGYNLFVMGPPGSGKHTMVRQFLEREATTHPQPSDWCYIHNFEQAHRPHAIRLPPGRGLDLRQHFDRLIDELQSAITSAFESEEYLSRIETIENEIKQRQKSAIGEVQAAAESEHIKLLRTADGFVFTPTEHDEIIDPDQFNHLSKAQQHHLEEIIEALQIRLRKVLEQFPVWAKQGRTKIKQLNRDTLRMTVHAPIMELEAHYSDIPEIIRHLTRMEADILDNIDNFHKPEEIGIALLSQSEHRQAPFTRYKVNLLINHSNSPQVPVVYEDQPNYQNLIGRVEHLSQMGTLITDFTLIKPGALHRANGGYLIIDAEKVLSQPYAWDALKRTLRSSEIRIDSLSQMLSLTNTVTLDPEPIPLEVKIVLLGDRHIYHMLNHYDPEFDKLFKIVADFEDEIDRTPNNLPLFARLIATICRQEKIMPLEKAAVARMVEYASRIAEDSEKLTTHMQTLCDLLCEADYCAQQRHSHNLIGKQDINKALQLQRKRVARIAEQLHEEVIRGDIHIATDGMQIGQINGLTVISLSNHTFGQPTRITATLRVGEGDIIDIERESEMAGPIHTKGVMILASYIGHRYSRNRPLALHASIVFEQSYGMIEGDSASLAELCALLSAIAEIPINQGFAITGSVNQHGEVQPIGGVNEKIEGFFRICAQRGLNGHQKIIIPQDNIKHLMLEEEIIEAVHQGKFHIYGVTNVDEAASLLMSIEAGEADLSGEYPENSLNAIINQKLAELAIIRHTFGDTHKENEDA